MEDDYVEIRGISREPLGKLAVEGWLAWPETAAVVAALTATGAAVRFVGGCVRDAVAHRPVKDVDIATPLPPGEVMELLARAGIKAVPTGIEHGTVTAVVGDKTFEITTLRKDVATDGRHAQVEFTDDWIADARRRDFTINAMSCAPSGDVYDPFEGMRDLAHGKVRFVGRADQRVQEDYLRILRFFRFYGAYGRPAPDQDALAACRTHAAKLKTLSGERVRDELLRILVVPDPADICIHMRGLGVMAEILPEAAQVTRLRLVNWLAVRGVLLPGLTPDPIRHLAALIETDAEGAAAVAQRLRLSNADTDRLVALAAPEHQVTPDLDALAREKLLRRLGSERFLDLALLAWASEMTAAKLPGARSAQWRDMLEFATAWQGRIFPLKGRDLLALGMAPGPDMGRVLAAVEAWWEDGGYAADYDACLAQAKKLIEEGDKA